ncbi:efflux RND transporter periplasmic adaptor subunit [Robertkochia solimangrovi]|uniref:efflux RND transporter periplasmic adaptor subunit n=1 Tax=Robertkochia solimangrovi TaxID=2213046 RepID=UPI00117F9A92|nr:efflux RND transporter periplasmic adaptor subunit [Robertkochia solimangrovi]TRZ43619.1 hypothetical protein DMZ48_09375 [Robertkochia solimangrovi]
MKMKLTLNSTAWLILGFTLPFLIASCKGTEEEKGTDPSAHTTDKVVISEEQFSEGGMEIQELKEVTFSKVIQTTGRFDVPPEYRAVVSSYFGGYIRNLKLLPGQYVKKGQVLFTLQDPEFLKIQEDYLKSKSAFEIADKDYRRQEILWKDKISADKRYEESRSNMESLAAQMTALEEKLRLMSLNPEKVRTTSMTDQIQIKAPISGYITLVNIVQGSYLSPQMKAVELVNTDHMHLELQVFQKDLPEIREEQRITFRPEHSEKQYTAMVHLVGKVIDPETGMVGVHGHMGEENESKFVPGMYVEAEIHVGDHPVRALPETAVVQVGNDHYALLLSGRNNGNYEFSKVPVTPGKLENGMIQVEDVDKFPENSQFLTKGVFALIQ